MICSSQSFLHALTESFLAPECDMSPLCDMELGYPERGTAELSVVTSNTRVSWDAAAECLCSAPWQSRVPLWPLHRRELA